jgi:hypothetical protein
MTSDTPDPAPPFLGVPPGMSGRWLAHKAQAEAELHLEAEEVAKKKREHEERIAREKRVVELLEQILEKLSEK